MQFAGQFTLETGYLKNLRLINFTILIYRDLGCVCQMAIICVTLSSHIQLRHFEYLNAGRLWEWFVYLLPTYIKTINFDFDGINPEKEKKPLKSNHGFNY